MKRGEIYEFHNERSDEVRTYELEEFETDLPGALARLRNVETDGIASITCAWLRNRAGHVPGTEWRLVS